MIDIPAFQAVLSKPQRIVILTHARPDGDAMGSSLGLMHYLQGRGHEAQVIIPNAYADFLRWLPGQEEVLDYQADPSAAAESIAKAELIFCLDFNTPNRVEHVAQHLLKSQATRVMIDHHRDPDAFTRFSYHDIKASSTAELVYRLLQDLGETERVDKNIATCLYVGMLTDTGSFKYSNTTPTTLRVAADLVEQGLDVEDMYARIYHTFSEDRMRFFGHCLVNNMQLFPEFRTGLITVNRQELERFRVRTGDTEGLVNYPLSITGIDFAVFMTDRTNLIKLSFRSKGDINVDAFAREHFNGGGHKNAAGGASTETLASTVERFIALLPQTPGLAAESASAGRPEKKPEPVKSIVLFAALGVGVLSCAADSTGDATAATQDQAVAQAGRAPLPADSATEAHRIMDREAIEAHLSENKIKDAKWTPSGMAYRVDQAGDGAAVKVGDIVKVHYTGKLLDGSTFDSSVERGTPLEFPIGQGRVIKGWDEGIPLFNVGGKGTLYIPSELGYGAQGFPGAIPEYSVLIFDIEVVDAFDPAEQEKRLAAEGNAIVEAYIKDNKLKTEKTASGLHYIIETPGTGEQAEAGKTVSVHYTGTFADGNVFDSSVERGEPIEFVLGQGRVIKGWDEGLALFKVGGKGTLIIPPHLGYGSQARGPIPANSMLLFDIELVDVK